METGSLLSRYPRFVYSKNNDSSLDGIPVFVYHTIEYELFESHLNYLNKNGYKTLSIHEFYDIISGETKSYHRKSVLITIDDARSSVWRYAFPLLKKYNMSATVFIIPGLTLHENAVRLNLDNYWKSQCILSDISGIDSKDESLCNWNEIKEMYNSGFVNIESHTLFHREIFSSNEIIDFITEETNFIPYTFIGSPYYNYESIGKPISERDYVGLPIFKSSPIMLSGSKLVLSDQFIGNCKKLYLELHGDLKRFKYEINKLSQLDSMLKIETCSEEDTLNDLKRAKEIIQDNLDNEAGNHLCLPWTKGNEITVKICKELNIKSCFWGLLKNIKINSPNSDPYFITRIKNDFIFRLPGNGRKSLMSIYLDKIKRRLSGAKVF